MGELAPTRPLWAEPAADCDACRELVVERRRQYAAAQYWRAQHDKALERVRALEHELELTRAKLRQRERELFERRSERRPGRRKEGTGRPKGGSETTRRRGQQKGAPGHGRRRHENLPAKVEERDLDESEKACSVCGEALCSEGGAEVSEVVEVEVKAHRRIIKRRRYRRTCNCTGVPRVVTAPPEPKLIPKGAYGVSFWVLVLLDKFCFQRPLHRTLSMLRVSTGLDVSRGTVTDGLARLAPLFEPLYAGIITQSGAAEAHWHADETRWFVFTDEDGESRYRTWYLWVFLSATAVAFRLDPTRSAKVPLEHFDEEVCGILSVDRYSAYKAMLKSRLLVLAYCWAHVRRDFLAVAKDWKGQHEAWGLDWVRQIANLYRLNEQRLAVLDDAEAWPIADGELVAALERMEKRRDEELAEPGLHVAQRKVLDSLAEHWSGLVVFAEYPDVPMDNNAAERELREEVIGRRNYHGSGAPWSAELAAMLFSVFRTLLLWRIDPRQWLTRYLTACAQNGGRPPPEPDSFLPWNMTEVERADMGSPTPSKADTS